MTAKTSSAEIKSVLNFRDAGGMQTTDGRRIKENVIFRSANPDKISRGDIKKLYDLDIRTIVDLRADYEGGNKKRRFESIETISLPLDFEQTTRERLMPLLKQKNSIDLIPGLIDSLYLEILNGSFAVFRKTIELLLDPARTPLLIHCQAGKDRTGIICALIQMALEADLQSIVNGYMTSNDMLLPHFKRKLTMRKILSLGFFPSDKILFAITVRDNNIRSVMDRVMTHYEGIEGYLSMSGPVSSEFKKLRERFVI